MKPEIEFRDSSVAFQAAINQGYFSDSPNKLDTSHGYAGDWMYMYSESAWDVFKNIMTRRCINIPIQTPISGEYPCAD